MEASAAKRTLTPAMLAALNGLTQAATVLTPTHRAARQLVEAFSCRKQADGLESWRSPNVLPWLVWTRATWSTGLVRGVTERVVLNTAQERALWIRILEDATGKGSATLSAQAERCMQAYRLLATYNADAVFRESYGLATSADKDLFRRCFLRFDELCRREAYLSAASLEGELATLVKRRLLPCAGAYMLYGFANLTPARQALVDALCQAGATMTRIGTATAPAAPPVLLQFAGREAQLRACAQWARQQLESAPEQVTAIVVPDLPAVRNEVERHLRHMVSPGSNNVVLSASPPYELAGGPQLLSLPLINHAWLLLRWCNTSLPLDDVGVLLRSPLLSLADSPDQGAMLDVSIVRPKCGLRKHLSVQRAAGLLQAFAAGDRLLDLSRSAFQLQDARQTYAWFADRIPQLLYECGWPGSSPLDALEQQAADRWQRVLDEVATLDLLAEKVSWTRFLEQLRAHLEGAAFAPKNLGRPLQVMTMREAEGFTADALWFLHADADTWPQRNGMDSLLPTALQRDTAMPGALREHDEEKAGTELKLLLESVKGETRLSWSSDAEDAMGKPSSCASQVVLAMGGNFLVAPEEQQEDFGTPDLETFKDMTPLPGLPEGDVFGGVSVLTAQAQCGFRAWAEKRVFASPMETVEDGLSSQDRGNQVHKILEKFWGATKSQAELRRQRQVIEPDGQSARDRLLRTCIAEVCSTTSPAVWDNAYLAVQQQRLFRLLANWLDYEETRPPFQIARLEQEVRHVPIGPLHLRLRVDRVDTVLAAPDSDEALGTLLIDYKTGRSSHNDWDGERPNLPQLPTYAVSAAAAGLPHVDGVAFASVHPGVGKARLAGVAQPGMLPPRRESDTRTFGEHEAEWQGNLEALASAFAHGDAAVDPKLYPQTCTTCAQRILCRLNASTLLQSDPDLLEDCPAEME